VLKAVVEAALGQENNSEENIKIAQEYFQVVGGSASERGQSDYVYNVYVCVLGWGADDVCIFLPEYCLFDISCTDKQLPTYTYTHN